MGSVWGVCEELGYIYIYVCMYNMCSCIYYICVCMCKYTDTVSETGFRSKNSVCHVTNSVSRPKLCNRSIVKV